MTIDEWMDPSNPTDLIRYPDIGTGSYRLMRATDYGPSPARNGLIAAFALIHPSSTYEEMGHWTDLTRESIRRIVIDAHPPISGIRREWRRTWTALIRDLNDA